MAKEKITSKNDRIKRKKSSTKKKTRSERNYSLSAIQEALKEINEGKSLRDAANKFNVPKSTLFRKLKNNTPVDCKKGSPPVLTAEEEADIVTWILYCADRGFPVTKKLLLDTVRKYVVEAARENPFKGNRPGYKWYRLFMKRHSDLSIRTAENLTPTRASVTEGDLREWFAKLKVALEEKNLLGIDPKRVLNCDESAFMLVPPKSNEVITKKGAGAVYKVVSSNEKRSLTVLFTASASGVLLPPMILFDL